MHRLLAIALVPAISLGLVAAPADARPTRSGHEQFAVVFAGPPGAPGLVIATGATRAVGTITPNDDDESGLDTFVFAQGSITVHSETSTTVRPSAPPSCITRFASEGTLEIVGGTGAFADWSGHGTVEDHGLAIAPQSGDGCAEEPSLILSMLRAAVTLD